MNDREKRLFDQTGKVEKTGDIGNYAVDEYNSSQWWYKELDKVFLLPIGNGVTADMKRASYVARNLMLAVEESRSSAESMKAELDKRDARVAQLEAEFQELREQENVGWKLVPIEPNEKMLFEGIAYVNNKTIAECMYRAMLAAAPVMEQVTPKK